MPSSDAGQIQPVLEAAYELRPHRVIDAGAGRGKYGLLVREYLPMVERIDAIEVWAPYVRGEGGFPLLGLVYDDVYRQAVQTFYNWGAYDLCLLIDVIEHLPRHQGVRLLDKVTAAGCAVIVATPRNWFQNPEADAVPSERHRSHWRPGDFAEWGAVDRSTDRGVIVRLPPRRSR